MKKLLLLLLIAPIIGNSQMLNLPFDGVIILQQSDTYTVPNDRILQAVSFPNGTSGVGFLSGASWVIDVNGSSLSGGQFGNPIFPGGTTITYLGGEWASFVLFDPSSQNLASNIPNQTRPTLYPNPTSSLLALNSDKEYDIEVYDMAGNKVMALTGNTIDMSHLSSATYIVKALDKVENEEVSYNVGFEFKPHIDDVLSPDKKTITLIIDCPNVWIWAG